MLLWYYPLVFSFCRCHNTHLLALPPWIPACADSVDRLLPLKLLNEAFAREVPWDGYKPADIKKFVESGGRPPIAMTMPTAAERLLLKAWHQIATLRPTFAEITNVLQAVEAAMPPELSTHGLSSLDMLPDALDELIR